MESIDNFKPTVSLLREMLIYVKSFRERTYNLAMANGKFPIFYIRGNKYSTNHISDIITTNIHIIESGDVVDESHQQILSDVQKIMIQSKKDM